MEEKVLSKYLIHACPSRKWYVDEYLVPSMLKQGIKESDIAIYNDERKLGNLKAYIDASSIVSELDGGTWHLQDDIVLSKRFKTYTEIYDRGIVCGFCSLYNEDTSVGIRPAKDMWYSFPCIRIPNIVLKSFIDWLCSPEIQTKFRAYILANKFDDSLFREYILENHRSMIIHNLYPNIVDNIDYMIGGSIINYTRDMQMTSLYFNEDDVKEELKHSLKESVYN